MISTTFIFMFNCISTTAKTDSHRDSTRKMQECKHYAGIDMNESSSSDSDSTLEDGYSDDCISLDEMRVCEESSKDFECLIKHHFKPLFEEYDHSERIVNNELNIEDLKQKLLALQADWKETEPSWAISMSKWKELQDNHMGKVREEWEAFISLPSFLHINLDYGTKISDYDLKWNNQESLDKRRPLQIDIKIVWDDLYSNWIEKNSIYKDILQTWNRIEEVVCNNEEWDKIYMKCWRFIRLLQNIEKRWHEIQLRVMRTQLYWNKSTRRILHWQLMQCNRRKLLSAHEKHEKFKLIGIPIMQQLFDYMNLRLMQAKTLSEEITKSIEIMSVTEETVEFILKCKRDDAKHKIKSIKESFIDFESVWEQIKSLEGEYNAMNMNHDEFKDFIDCCQYFDEDELLPNYMKHSIIDTPCDTSLFLMKMNFIKYTIERINKFAITLESIEKTMCKNTSDLQDMMDHEIREINMDNLLSTDNLSSTNNLSSTDDCDVKWEDLWQKIDNLKNKRKDYWNAESKKTGVSPFDNLSNDFGSSEADDEDSE